MYWVSWYQPTEDYRPTSHPPNEGVLGWWCTGYAPGRGATLCAAVAANDEETAKFIIRLEWPEVREWRFVEPRDNPNFGSRFPLSDWMVERFSKFPGFQNAQVNH